jgi:hypothetical protein
VEDCCLDSEYKYLLVVIVFICLFFGVKNYYFRRQLKLNFFLFLVSFFAAENNFFIFGGFFFAIKTKLFLAVTKMLSIIDLFLVVAVENRAYMR